MHLVFKKDLKSKDLINQVSWFPYCSRIFPKIFVLNYDSHPNYPSSSGLSVNIKPSIVPNVLSTAGIFLKRKLS